MSMRGPLRIPIAARFRPRTRQRGAALVEYTVIVLMLVIVLIAEDDVIKRLADALRTAYAAFVYALSISWA